MLQRFSPRLAAAVAFHIFLRPFRRPVREEDREIMARSRMHRIVAGSDQIRVHEWGDGERVALIAHGWGSRSARFTPLAATLVARGWRVLAFDAPAHGESPGRLSSLPQFVSALDTVAQRFGPPTALIGHSLGALAVASSFRTAAPAWSSSLQAVVLISMPSGAPFLIDNFVQMLGIGTAAADRMLASFRRRFDATPTDFAALPGVARIAAPVLLVHDRDDDIVPHVHSEALLSQLPDAHLLTTTGQGHSNLTRDSATIEAIAKFITTGGSR